MNCVPIQPRTQTRSNHSEDLVLLDAGEAVLLDAEDLVLLDAEEPVMLDADLVFGLV